MEMLNEFRMFIIVKKMAGESTVTIRDLELLELKLRELVPPE